MSPRLGLVEYQREGESHAKAIVQKEETDAVMNCARVRVIESVLKNFTVNALEWEIVFSVVLSSYYECTRCVAIHFRSTDGIGICHRRYIYVYISSSGML